MAPVKPAALMAALVLILAACGGAAGPTQAPGSTGTPAGGGGTPEPTAAGGGGTTTGGDCVAPGTNTANGSVEGSIVTTGAYPATWTFVVGNNGVAIGIGSPSGTIGLTANTEPGATPGPGADLKVDSAGNIEFGGILPGPKGESLPPNVGQIFTGTGAQATFCKPTAQAADPYMCAVTVDNDVTGSTDSSAKLHLKGTLTIKDTVPTTLGGLTITC
jgi:hypothetical protein